MRTKRLNYLESCIHRYFRKHSGYEFHYGLKKFTIEDHDPFLSQQNPIGMFVKNISDKSLTKINIKAKGERLANVAVFPFFDREGEVKQVMLVLPDEKVVSIIPMKQGLVQVGIGNVLKFSMDLAEIKSYANFNPQQIAQVFHYDTQWTFSRSQFSRYRAKELIKQTNCANLLEKKVRNLLFSSDLSSIDGFIMRKGYLNLFYTMKAGMMALAALPSTAGGPPGMSVDTEMNGWRISPIWNEWGSS